MTTRSAAPSLAASLPGTSRPGFSNPWLSSPWLFFLTVFAWSWLFWISAAVLGMGITTPVGAVLGLLGLLGPMLGGIGYTVVTRDHVGRQEYWRRIIDPKRIGARWYLVIVLFVPVLMSLATGLDLLSGGSAAPFEQAVASFLSRPLSILPFALGIFFLGPFPEELGWRGYALDRLQEKWSPLASSLILGVA